MIFSSSSARLSTKLFLVQIVHIEEICGRKANYVEIPGELSEHVKSALNCIGVTRLYSHQVLLSSQTVVLFNSEVSAHVFHFVLSAGRIN